jgi:hypothetical protein
MEGWVHCTENREAFLSVPRLRRPQLCSGPSIVQEVDLGLMVTADRLSNLVLTPPAPLDASPSPRRPNHRDETHTA